MTGEDGLTFAVICRLCAMARIMLSTARAFSGLTSAILDTVQGGGVIEHNEQSMGCPPPSWNCKGSMSGCALHPKHSNTVQCRSTIKREYLGVLCFKSLTSVEFFSTQPLPHVRAFKSESRCAPTSFTGLVGHHCFQHGAPLLL